MSATTDTTTLPNVDWTGVRPIYKKLSDEFHVLTKAYKIQLDENRKVMLDHLIVVIDEVDIFVDDLPHKTQRDEVTTSLVDYLEDNEEIWKHPLANESLPIKIYNLKRVIRQLGITKSFVGAAKSIFHFTEIKRHTESKEELINYISQEGAATALMPLSILDIAPSHPFGKFFTRMCTLMGIADLVFDARDDYRNNIISIKPHWSLYVSLIKITLVDGIKMLWHFPDKLALLIYCFKFTIVLFKEN